MKSIQIVLEVSIILVFGLCKGQLFTGCEFVNLLPHPTNCSKFLQCGNGYIYEMNCPEELVFNFHTQRCDWLWNVQRYDFMHLKILHKIVVTDPFFTASKYLETHG